MPSSASTAPRKLHRYYTPFVFAFYMVLIMAFLMCSTIVALNSGFNAFYWTNVLHAYLLGMPVAFFCVIVIRPLVMRLVTFTVYV